MFYKNPIYKYEIIEKAKSGDKKDSCIISIKEDSIKNPSYTSQVISIAEQDCLNFANIDISPKNKSLNDDIITFVNKYGLILNEKNKKACSISRSEFIKLIKIMQSLLICKAYCLDNNEKFSTKVFYHLFYLICFKDIYLIKIEQYNSNLQSFSNDFAIQESIQHNDPLEIFETILEKYKYEKDTEKGKKAIRKLLTAYFHREPFAILAVNAMKYINNVIMSKDKSFNSTEADKIIESHNILLKKIGFYVSGNLPKREKMETLKIAADKLMPPDAAILPFDKLSVESGKEAFNLLISIDFEANPSNGTNSDIIGIQHIVDFLDSNKIIDEIFREFSKNFVFDLMDDVTLFHLHAQINKVTNPSAAIIKNELLHIYDDLFVHKNNLSKYDFFKASLTSMYEDYLNNNLDRKKIIRNLDKVSYDGKIPSIFLHNMFTDSKKLCKAVIDEYFNNLIYYDKLNFIATNGALQIHYRLLITGLMLDFYKNTGSIKLCKHNYCNHVFPVGGAKGYNADKKYCSNNCATQMRKKK